MDKTQHYLQQLIIFFFRIVLCIGQIVNNKENMGFVWLRTFKGTNSSSFTFFAMLVKTVKCYAGQNRKYVILGCTAHIYTALESTNLGWSGVKGLMMNHLYMLMF